MPNTQPLVSIIIPTYNRAHLIGETLDSVLAQTYPHWECIVVDDGSSDGTDALLANYCEKDSRFQYHPRPTDKPKGANACRNYGFELSKGKYINWFDDDDVMQPDFINLKKTFLEAHTGVDAVISKTIVFEGNPKNTIGKENRTFLTQNLLEDFLSLKVSWSTYDPMWKKSFLKNKSLFDVELFAGQDRDFHTRMLLEKPVLATIDYFLTFYRKHENNITTSIDNLASVDLKKNHLQSVIKLIGHLETHKVLNERIKRNSFRSLIKYLPFLINDPRALNELIRVLKHLSFFDATIFAGWLKFFAAFVSIKLTGKGQRLLK